MSSAGLRLMGMVLADQNSWDRYVAAQWWTVYEWMRATPDDPDVPVLRETIASWQRTSLEYGRRYFGWVVFVLRTR